jgi:hypothetical protein
MDAAPGREVAREVEAVLREDARTLFDAMYGNKPDKWSETLRGMDRCASSSTCSRACATASATAPSISR